VQTPRTRDPASSCVPQGERHAFPIDIRHYVEGFERKCPAGDTWTLREARTRASTLP
jgi:hypothetical protein